MYLEHIASNQTVQDKSAVCCIIDAALQRENTELNELSDTWVLSDNASCYENNLLPVIFPFIADDAGIKLGDNLHSETQRGNSLVDA